MPQRILLFQKTAARPLDEPVWIRSHHSRAPRQPPPLNGEVQLPAILPGRRDPGLQHQALQQLGFALAHIGQFAVMSVVVLPPIVVTVPPHIGHSCVEPTATVCGAHLPLVFVADVAVTTVSVQAWQTIAGAVAAAVEGWTLDLPADCQYWNPGPA